MNTIEEFTQSKRGELIINEYVAELDGYIDGYEFSTKIIYNPDGSIQGFEDTYVDAFPYEEDRWIEMLCEIQVRVEKHLTN